MSNKLDCGTRREEGGEGAALGLIEYNNVLGTLVHLYGPREGRREGGRGTRMHAVGQLGLRLGGGQPKGDRREVGTGREGIMGEATNVLVTLRCSIRDPRARGQVLYAWTYNRQISYVDTAILYT